MAKFETLLLRSYSGSTGKIGGHRPDPVAGVAGDQLVPLV